MLQLPPALAGLAAYRQFLGYKLVWNEARNKYDKIPFGSTTDPSSWKSFDEVAALVASGHSAGIGFVFSNNDPFWFLDIDRCLTPDGWNAIAQQMIDVFYGHAAIEVSTSGQGLHIIGSGMLPAHGCRNTTFDLELYHTERFIALTGSQVSGDVTLPCPPHLLEWLVSSYFPKSAGGDIDPGAELVDGPVPEWNGPTDDEALLRRAMQSKSAASAFGAKASFADLWTADPAVLATFYPSSTDAYDRSSADAALAQHLAFWTGKDGARIERLMNMSGLKRDKWEDREGYYIPRTINKAISMQKDVLHDKPIEAAAPVISGGVGRIAAVEGSTFVSIDQQAAFFEGCTYVVSAHRVLTKDGSLLRPDQFRAKYGGYSFPMDNANQRVVRNAWECFTESQTFRAPKADATMFRPDLPPGYILTNGGYSRVNTFVPVAVPRQRGDASPFLRHMELLLPDERDRTILLSYMAACVQHMGVKFQWAPLVQGVPGNGKTLFTRCLIEAVGERYCHIPTVESITQQFNAWLFDKVLIGVEDVYSPEFKGDMMEVLKPMITGEFLSKRAMQTDHYMQNSVANFIFNTNHKNGLRKDREDRRIAPFFCAQQKVEHLARDGMTETYFVALYNWLRSGGYAIVTDFLYSFDIPDEFNPATSCQRAPITTSTNSAIEESLGGIEQEILEAVVRDSIGFRGGFISSAWLDTLLQKLGAARRIPHNRRREILEPLGYTPHPALPDGRVSRFIMPDGSRSRLFVRKDSPYALLTDGEQVIQAYEKENMLTA